METKGITCRIPLALHQKITEEMRAQGITVGQFIEQIIHEHYEKGDPTMAKTRTMAFQISEELFQRIKEYLTRYEQVYGRRLTQKEFVLRLIENALDEADEEEHDHQLDAESKDGGNAALTEEVRIADGTKRHEDDGDTGEDVEFDLRNEYLQRHDEEREEDEADGDDIHQRLTDIEADGREALEKGGAGIEAVVQELTRLDDIAVDRDVRCRKPCILEGHHDGMVDVVPVHDDEEEGTELHDLRNHLAHLHLSVIEGPGGTEVDRRQGEEQCLGVGDEIEHPRNAGILEKFQDFI